MSMYSVQMVSAFLLSCIMKVLRKECLGEMSLFLSPFSYIFFPTGDSIAISKVIIWALGTKSTVSPFLMSLAAWTPL